MICDRRSHSLIDSDDAGFSLVEVVVAMFILAIIAMSMAALIIKAQAQSVTNRDRVAAANLAARELDLVRQEFFATPDGPLTIADAGYQVNQHPLPGGSADSPLVVDGVAYTVERNAAWDLHTVTGASTCDGGGIVRFPSVIVSVTVTWDDMGTVQPVKTSTVLAPDKDKGADTKDAYLAVKVTDQAAAPLDKVRVKVSSGGSSVETDAAGCAVIRVSPATAGSSYTVGIDDASYVDLSGTANPTKPTGVVQQGTISYGVKFTIAHPGTLKITMVDSDGKRLPDGTASEVIGSSVTVVPAETSLVPFPPVTVTGITTTITGLWPTLYSAYFGSSAPASGYQSAQVTPGGTGEVTVVFVTTHLDVTSLPAGSSWVYAYAAGAADVDCSSGGAKATVTGAAASMSLAPGSYDLYVVGDTFGCSPGPAGVSVDSDDSVDWGTSKLALKNVPSGGRIWAVEMQKSGLTNPGTCPTSSSAIAVDVDAARSGTAVMPAGRWYVYLTSGAADASCKSYPDLLNPVNVVYGATTTENWSTSPPVLTMTGMSNGRVLLVSTAAVSTCTTTTATTSGSKYTSASTALGGTASVTVPTPSSNVTYYAYQWQTSGGSGNRCSAAGNFLVGPSTTSLTKAVSEATKGP